MATENGNEAQNVRGQFLGMCVFSPADKSMPAGRTAMADPRRTLPAEVREELVVVDWKKTIVEYHETKKRLPNCEMPIGKLAKAIGAMKYIENMARSEVGVRFGEHVGCV